MKANLKYKYNEEERYAKPILKWAGGKGQMLPYIRNSFPDGFGTSIRKYVEPFIGGGAVFFDLYNSNLIDEAILTDNNQELVLLYNTIKYEPNAVINKLSDIESIYIPSSTEKRKEFYYKARDDFNANRRNKYTNLDPERAALIIFINRTCFNGLYRVNSKGGFNVPQGSYKNPKILNSENIYQVSDALQIAKIIHGDFSLICNQIDDSYFVYYDPPYRPLSKTSSFNAYSGAFDDSEQRRLAEQFAALNDKGIQQMLSNSDPLSASGDDFFEKLYSEFDINKVEASRMINATASKRGKIFELLITNYDKN